VLLSIPVVAGLKGLDANTPRKLKGFRGVFEENHGALSADVTHCHWVSFDVTVKLGRTTFPHSFEVAFLPAMQFESAISNVNNEVILAVEFQQFGAAEPRGFRLYGLDAIFDVANQWPEGINRWDGVSDGRELRLIAGINHRFRLVLPCCFIVFKQTEHSICHRPLFTVVRVLRNTLSLYQIHDRFRVQIVQSAFLPKFIPRAFPILWRVRCSGCVQSL